MTRISTEDIPSRHVSDNAAQVFDEWLAALPEKKPAMSIDDVKPGQIWQNTQNRRRIRVIAVTQFGDVQWEAVDGLPGMQNGTRWGTDFLGTFILDQEATE